MITWKTGYFYVESACEKLKIYLETPTSMAELGKVRRNRLSQIGKLNATASDFLKLEFWNTFWDYKALDDVIL